MPLTYTLDRSPETVARRGHPELLAFTLRSAAKGHVQADRDHRRICTAADAKRLCKLFYGVALDDAVAKGLV